MEENKKDQLKVFKPFYLFDEFDRFISATYGLEVDEYIHIVDTLMSEEDAIAFFDFTAEEQYDKGLIILKKYL
jgi:hypothetical protein